MVRSEKGEFEQHEMRLPIYNNRILLETIEKRLDLHKPPLRINSVNNVPAVAHPADKTLAVELRDGQRLDLVAEIAPGTTYNVMSCITHVSVTIHVFVHSLSNHCAGFTQFNAYPQPFAGFAKGLQWSWIHT